MRIAIDARAAVSITDGIGRYAVELLKAYSMRNDDNQYLVLKHPGFSFSFEFDERFKQISVFSRRFGLTEQFQLPRIVQHKKIEVFHSLHFTIPLGMHCARIVTVHDIMPIVLPWFFGTRGIKSKLMSLYLTALVKCSVKNAHRVIADSDHTAREVVDRLGCEPDRVRRIYLGTDHFRNQQPSSNSEEMTQLGLSGPFLLTVTNFRPYKNIPRLLEAFKAVQAEIPGITLAVVGGNQKYFIKTLGYSNDHSIPGVSFLGFVRDDVLSVLLKKATAFVFPSLYEGFGFPILEAMSAGIPVVTTKAASLPELGGDAVVYAEASDVADISRAILAVCTDKKLQQELIDRGQKQAARFQWRMTAEQTLQIYKEALNKRGSTT